MQKKLDLTPGKMWPKQVADFIAAHCKGFTTKQLTDTVNAEFGTDITTDRMLSYKKNHKLKSGFTGQFEKGHIPYTKGKRIEEFMSPDAIERSSRTYFKKGNSPKNRYQVGTEVVKDDDYLWRKIAEPNKWRQVHRLVYEQLHGSIPRACVSPSSTGTGGISARTTWCSSVKDENRILNHKGLRHTDKTIATTALRLRGLNQPSIKSGEENDDGYEKHTG
jgi:hypothetical protein